MGVPTPSTTTTTTEVVQKLCSRVAPCKWAVYDRNASKRINLEIDNPT